MKTKLAYLIIAVLVGVIHVSAQTPTLNQTLKKAASGNVDACMQAAVCYMTGTDTEKNEEQGFYYLQKAADKGDAEALFHVGECYLSGRGVSIDTQKALEAITRSAEAGFSPAQCALGEMYIKGCRYEYVSSRMKYLPIDLSLKSTGTLLRDQFTDEFQGEPFIPADPSRGLEWLTAAADNDEPGALYILAIFYMDSDIVEPDSRESLYYMERAAENGVSAAMEQMGDWYEEGYAGIIEPDRQKAFDWNLRAAEKGNTYSMCMIGEYYEDGKGVVEPDTDKMIQWYRKAAEYAYPDPRDYNLWAQRKLGLIYATGDGVQQDITEATKWFRMAAESGDTEAQYFLGIIYYSDEYGVKNIAKALFWFTKAADNGHVRAMVVLGDIYMTGDGVAKDETAGFEYFAQAADKGNTSAMIELSKAYWNGWGCAVDKHRAIEICIKAGDMGDAAGYRQAAAGYHLLAENTNNRKEKRELDRYGFIYVEKAAQMGDPNGQYGLALHYGNGKGCKKNEDMLYYWLKKAMAQNYQPAIDHYNKMREIHKQYNLPWKW